MNTYNETLVINEINKNKNFLESIKKEIDIKNYYRDLIFAEIIRNIKYLSKCYEIVDECAEKAANYINDNQEYASNIQSYNLLKDTIEKELFNGESINIDKVFKLGYDLNNYGYSFEITYENYRFAIIIPDYRYITIENYEYCNEGKFVLQVKKNDSLWMVLDSSYNLGYLRPKMMEFCEKNFTN